MRNILFTMFFSIALLTVSFTSCFAQSASEIVDIEYFEDGSYGVTTECDVNNGISYFSENSVSKKATYTYYTNSGTKCWEFSLIGVFSYDGSSARATSSSTGYRIYLDSWTCDSRTSSKSGATVRGTGVFKKGAATVTKNLGLKCSATGTVTAL